MTVLQLNIGCETNNCFLLSYFHVNNLIPQVMFPSLSPDAGYMSYFSFK